MQQQFALSHPVFQHFFPNCSLYVKVEISKTIYTRQGQKEFKKYVMTYEEVISFQKVSSLLLYREWSGAENQVCLKN